VKRVELGWNRHTILSGVQFHYHGKLQPPTPNGVMADTRYVLAILDGRLEVNAHPITYINNPVQQFFYPRMMNEHIWSVDENNAKFLIKTKRYR
jgi:hypothetical protein